MKRLVRKAWFQRQHYSEACCFCVAIGDATLAREYAMQSEFFAQILIFWGIRGVGVHVSLSH